MFRKVKVEEIFTYELVTNSEVTQFNEYLYEELYRILHRTYNVDSEEYQSSALHNLLTTSGLNVDYFVEHSSEKWLSKFALLLYEKYKDDMSELYVRLAEDVVYKYGFKWWKISNAITTDYKPLENYNMEELRTPDLEESNTRKQETDVNVNQESGTGIYGFNSTEAQPTATGSGDTHTTGSKAKNVIEDVKTNTGTESLTRHGNIGVTTSQQMLESEIKLRQYNFVEEVFKDIDSILCLKIY